jgi:CotH kinase protein/Lamin Tail Domain/Secretion system C-terminal sorting domain
MKTYLFIFFIFISSTLYAQWNKPPTEPIFKDNEVMKVKVFLEADSLNEMLDDDNLDSYHEYPSRFVIRGSELNDTIENVGLRIRGNTSRYSAKKSFKISFNTFEEGRDYFGLEKMNLNGEHNDPSIVRSKLCWDILYDFNVPATRSNHVELYINNEYRGLYTNVEHIDEEFVESRFGNKDGNLYKCLWPSDLIYMGTNQSSYENVYELKTNTETNDYSDLINLIEVINNTPIDQFPTELEKIFNINNFLKFHAVEVFTAHWDSYSFLKNNFYLYHNTKTGKFEYIPYDMDNTFGIDWFQIDWAERNIYNWSNDGEYRPLIERLMEIDIYKERFSYYLRQLIDNVVGKEILFPKIESIKDMISPSAQVDDYRTYDYGWSYNDFLNSYEFALSSNHVTYGLKEYIENRLSSIEEQIQIVNIDPIIYYSESSFPSLNTDLTINSLIEDETNNLNVELFYELNSVSNSLIMNRVNDSKMDNYQALIDLSESGTLNYYINATDSNGNTTRYPISGVISIIVPNEQSSGLYINEIMAGNTNTYADEFGDYDDWIEIYNSSNESISLGDYYLSDNANIPSKFQFPEMNINAGDYLIVWADRDVDQGNLHADFKLSKDGEEVILSKMENSLYETIDYINYGQIESDVSYGKLPDGNGILHLLSPTPGSANLILDIPLFENDFTINVYPNPFIDYLKIESNSIIKNISIINIYGQVVFNKSINNKNLEIYPALSTGVYFVQTISEFGERKIKKVIAN